MLIPMHFLRGLVSLCVIDICMKLYASIRFMKHLPKIFPKLDRNKIERCVRSEGNERSTG